MSNRSCEIVVPSLMRPRFGSNRSIESNSPTTPKTPEEILTSLLNKLSPNNHETIQTKIVEALENSSEDTSMDFGRILYAKSRDEESFSALYMSLLQAIEKRAPKKWPGVKKALLQNLQAEFINPPAVTSKELDEYERSVLFAKRVRGNAKLFSELFKVKILPEGFVTKIALTRIILPTEQPTEQNAQPTEQNVPSIDLKIEQLAVIVSALEGRTDCIKMFVTIANGLKALNKEGLTQRTAFRLMDIQDILNRTK